MNKEKINYKIFAASMISVIIWFLIAHGYRMSNLIYFHDTLLNTVRADIAFQQSLGRFVQPFVILLFGSITSSWLISVVAILFFGLSVWLLCDIFDFDGKVEIFFLAGLLICNNVLTTANYMFLPWLDIYAMALFFSVLGVRLLLKGKIPYIIGGCFSLILSLGLYQAYISVALAIVIILFVKELYSGKKFKDIYKYTLMYIGSFILSGGLYYIIYRVVLAKKGLAESDSYNGLASVAKFDFGSVPSLIGTTYYNFFRFLSEPGIYASGKIHGTPISTFINICIIAVNILAFIILIAGLIRINIIKKNSALSVILQVFLIAVFPFASNFVCFMSKGVEHALMTFGILLVYVFAFIVLKENIKLTDSGKTKIPMQLIIVPVLWLILNNVVYSNQIYVKAHIQEQNYLSIMTRIVYQIENTEGYKWGETPVAFVGIFGNSNYIPTDVYFDQIGTGITPFTNNATYINYLKYHLGANINVYELPVTENIAGDMPCFPEQGYIQFIDDILVVKISD